MNFSSIPPLPRLLILLGLVLLAAGLVAWALHGRSGWWQWLGRLPGDIRIERDNFRFYAPITTMLLLSLLASLVLRLIRHWWG